MKRVLLLSSLISHFSFFAFTQKIFTLEIKGKPENAVINKLSYKKSFTSKPECDKEIQNVLFHLYDNAYLTASLDSSNTDSLKKIVFVKVGEQYKWTTLRKGNADEGILSVVGYKEKFFSGKPFYYKEAGKLQKKILTYCENNGYPFASVKLDSILISGTTLSATI